jgi:hypothetical protein
VEELRWRNKVNFLLIFFFKKVNVISFENYTRLFLHISKRGLGYYK